MPLISVITATLRPNEEFVLQAWKSILASAPTNWEFEWCIQEDGKDPSLRDALPADERIRYDAHSVQAGVAASRNLAMARSRGDWIVNLDGDDYYTERGLTVLTDLINTHDDIIWIGARAHDYVQATGEVIGFPNYLPDGHITADEFERYRRKAEPTFPLHVAGAGFRRDVALTLGGYFASPFGQDVALFFAITQLGNGAYTSEPAFFYRRWNGQSTRQEAHTIWGDRRFEIQRVEAMRKLNLRIDV